MSALQYVTGTGRASLACSSNLDDGQSFESERDGSDCSALGRIRSLGRSGGTVLPPSRRDQPSAEVAAARYEVVSVPLVRSLAVEGTKILGKMHQAYGALSGSRAALLSTAECLPQSATVHALVWHRITSLVRNATAPAAMPRSCCLLVPDTTRRARAQYTPQWCRREFMRGEWPLLRGRVARDAGEGNHVVSLPCSSARCSVPCQIEATCKKGALRLTTPDTVACNESR